MTEGSAARRRRGVTLKEIAEKTGVHVSTVSRVLRQDAPPDGWSEAALRVRTAAADMGYQPNPWAASLRTRRTGVLGAVMPRLTDGVIANMYQGVQQAAERAGYSVLLSSPEDDSAAMVKALQLVIGRFVDGVVVSGLRSPAGPILNSLGTDGTPILLLSRHADSDLPSVTVADFDGGELAAQHLVALGHRHLGVIAGPDDASNATERVAGFIHGLREAGIKIPRRMVVPSGFDVQGGVEAAERLLASSPRPTGLFAVNDAAAIGAMGVARDRQLSVPGDLSIIGFNDLDVSAQLPVALSTIRTQARQVGEEAVQALLQLMAGQTVESRRVPVELVARASTGPAPQ